jgi:phosphatidate cytidylyltransferase
MAESANSNLLFRFVTAVVAVPGILALLYVAPPIAFFGLIVAATFIGGLELFAMTHKDDKLAQIVHALSCVLVAHVVYFFGDSPKALLATMFLVPSFAVLFPLVRLGNIETAALRIGAGVLGPFYVGSMALLARLIKERGFDGSGYVLLVLMISWFADTGGYFAGRFLGKHKLYEAVSPKKTVEGAIGGLAGSVVGALLAHFVYLKSIPLAHAIPLALVASALGQAGDLGESLIKRSVGVKDSGALLPGHGGILDRVDAVLICAPIVYLYTRFVLG